MNDTVECVERLQDVVDKLATRGVDTIFIMVALAEVAVMTARRDPDQAVLHLEGAAPVSLFALRARRIMRKDVTKKRHSNKPQILLSQAMSTEDWQRDGTLFPEATAALHETGLIIEFRHDEAGAWTAQAVNASEWSHGDRARLDRLATLLLQAQTLFQISTRNNHLRSSEE